ncbi:hypothetical protein TNCV_2432001 [Trichonephila clavipes]|nr:hypothetical protein TNCV_2432001 [Trichonephila clavipes]
MVGGRQSPKLQLQFLHLPCLQETEFCGRNVLSCPTSVNELLGVHSSHARKVQWWEVASPQSYNCSFYICPVYRKRNFVEGMCCLAPPLEKRLDSDRRHHQKQREFESQEQHVIRVTEQCDRYHESQGQRIERLAQLRESVRAIRQEETNFDRERRLFTSRQTTSALRDIESEENR